jgi:AGZA family xanthine/uracil permease-like MFS transporter
MPQSLVLAVGAGIGLFIAYVFNLVYICTLTSFLAAGRFIGLGPGGLAVIGGDTVNLVGLGGCKAEDFVSSDLPNYCARRVLQSPTVWLGIFMGGYAQFTNNFPQAKPLTFLQLEFSQFC